MCDRQSFITVLIDYQLCALMSYKVTTSDGYSLSSRGKKSHGSYVGSCKMLN